MSFSGVPKHLLRRCLDVLGLFFFFGSPFSVVVKDDVGKSVQQSQKTNIRLWGPPAPAHQVVEQ